MIESIEEIKQEFEYISKLGKKFRKTGRTRRVYHLICDVCKRKMTRSKGEASKTEIQKYHCCSNECIGKLSLIDGSAKKRTKFKPHRRKTGYMYVGKEREHRIVAKQMLGRNLEKNDNVHHIDGDKGHNKPENLLVCDKKQHNRIHGQLEALAFLLVQQGAIKFCKQCEIYHLEDCNCN